MDDKTNLEQSPLRPAVAWSSLLGAFLLTSCAVNEQHIQAAQRICEDHGGILNLYAAPYIEVHCKDGLVATDFGKAQK